MQQIAAGGKERAQEKRAGLHISREIMHRTKKKGMPPDYPWISSTFRTILIDYLMPEREYIV